MGLGRSDREQPGGWGHQGAALSGRAWVREQTPKATPGPRPGQWVQVLVPDLPWRQDPGQRGTGGDVVCHLQSWPAAGWLRTCSWPTQRGPLVVAAHSAFLRGSGLSGHQPRGLPGGATSTPEGSRGCGPRQSRSGAASFRAAGLWGFSREPLSQADPGAPAPGAGAVTPAHPRGGWHGSCLAQRPPSVPIIGRTTRRVLLTPQPGQAQGGWAGPFHLPGPQLPLSLAWTGMFLNSISQGPRGLLGRGRGPASEAAHKGAASLLETRRKEALLGFKNRCRVHGVLAPSPRLASEHGDPPLGVSPLLPRHPTRARQPCRHQVHVFSSKRLCLHSRSPQACPWGGVRGD